MQTLGSYLREQRERRGWLQTELAARSGVPQATISAIETGTKKLPGADTRRKLCRALGVRHADMLIAAGELELDEVELGPAPTNPRVAEIIKVLEGINDDAVFGAVELILSRVQMSSGRRVLTG